MTKSLSEPGTKSFMSGRDPLKKHVATPLKRRPSLALTNTTYTIIHIFNMINASG